MLPALPPIAHHIAAPPVVWRVETGFRHDPDTSAADVVRYEQEELGNPLGIVPPLLLDLDAYPAAALLWVAFTRADALRYGNQADLIELQLDIPAYVLAEDGNGGYLLFFADNAITSQSEGATMSNSADELRDEIKAEAQGLSPEEAAALAARVQATDAQQRGAANQADPILSPQPSRNMEPEEDEETRRRGRGGGGDMPNPAHAQHALNIRPDVVHGPAGLEVITTMKSAHYDAESPAGEPQTVSEHLRGKLAEAAHDEGHKASPDHDAAPGIQAYDPSEAERDPVARQAEEQSTRRQEAERLARSGETPTGDQASYGRESSRARGGERRAGAWTSRPDRRRPDGQGRRCGAQSLLAPWQGVASLDLDQQGSAAMSRRRCRP
jgi:hypothetical protein